MNKFQKNQVGEKITLAFKQDHLIFLKLLKEKFADFILALATLAEGGTSFILALSHQRSKKNSIKNYFSNQYEKKNQHNYTFENPWCFYHSWNCVSLKAEHEKLNHYRIPNSSLSKITSISFDLNTCYTHMYFEGWQHCSGIFPRPLRAKKKMCRRNTIFLSEKSTFYYIPSPSKKITKIHEITTIVFF